VDQIITLLQLRKCQDRVVGSIMEKGISGGERRRVSVGCQLITNPSLLFLDEPTSGLDTYTAFNVMQILRDLAHRENRTIVATIHQPSSEIWALFDDLCVLADGQVLYHGPAGDEAVNYFARQGYQCPRYSNPADFLVLYHKPGTASSPLIHVGVLLTDE
jgi:ABC-type multidrug transport system ATPase subunit